MKKNILLKMALELAVNLALLCVLLISCSLSVRAADRNKETPNILFIALDDMNDWIGALGGHPQAKTPNIDKLASEGVLFTNAHTCGPACSPSRNAVMYGMEPYNSGLYVYYDRVEMNPEFFKDHKSLLEIFRSNGYNTYGVGEVHHASLKESSMAYFDSIEYTENHNQALKLLPQIEIDSTDGYGSTVHDRHCFRPSTSPIEHFKDYEASQFGIDVLQRKHEKPFFLALGFSKPHLPMVVPKKYFDMFPYKDVETPLIKDDDLADIPWAGRSNVKLKDDVHFRNAKSWRAVTRAYLASTAFLDDMIGRIINALNNSEYKENTIVILWSDHGYHLGEKRSHRKFSLWEESTHVPLIVLDPANKSNGKTCAAPVSLVDLFPTLLSMGGFEIPVYSDGLDLRVWLDNPDLEREKPAITTWGQGNYALRTARWRYIRYFDGSEELYDHNSDSNEWHNLAGNDKYSKVIKELQAYLPQKSAPRVVQGNYKHNAVDTEYPSLDEVKALWKEMQIKGMFLE